MKKLLLLLLLLCTLGKFSFAQDENHSEKKKVLIKASFFLEVILE